MRGQQRAASGPTSHLHAKQREPPLARQEVAALRQLWADEEEANLRSRFEQWLTDMTLQALALWTRYL